jgi:hypothetical protein
MFWLTPSSPMMAGLWRKPSTLPLSSLIFRVFKGQSATGLRKKKATGRMWTPVPGFRARSKKMSYEVMHQSLERSRDTWSWW